MVQIIKSGTIKVPTQPKDFDLKATGLVFKSYDNRVALEFNVEKQDGTPADLLGANLRLLMFIYDEIDGTVTKEPIPFITKNLITESFLNGHVVYILPEAMKAYNGMVETYVYIEYSDGSTSDNLGFTFRMQRSKIDGLAQDKADYFITDFQQLLDAVKQKAADAVNETLAKVEASSTKMQELEQRIDEQTEIFNNADVYNKAEIEDKLEPFALRTDIDTLDAVKADKKSLALTDSKVADLDSVKADKTALSQTNILLTNGLNSKVDKGGIEQVTLPMLTTEVKKAMTGGSVAVVSDGAVSTSTVVDKAITSAKAVASIQHPQVTLATDPPNYDTETKLLTFPSSGATGGNSVITYGNGAKTYFIPNDGTFSVLNTLPGKTTKLIFDFSTNTMSFIEWNVNLTKNQAVLLTMRGNGQYISSNIFPVTVDRKMAGIGKDIATNNQVSGSSIQISKDAPIRCIAHRGYSNSYPEDTLVAYRGAKKAGINEVEMDLSWTSDNIPVNIHDSTINRTARNVDGSEIDETINVSNCSLAELKQYEYGSYLSPEFLGEQIPTFEDTLKQCKILDQVLHIDRCWGLGDDRLTILKNVMDKIDYHDVVFYIYHEDSLNRLRNIIPKADVMHLLLGGDITQESIDLCSTYNLSNKRGDGQAQILAKADGVTQAQVQKANNAGVKVNVWGADNADRQQLMSWGVTGFSTNYVNIQDELLDI